MKRKLTLVRRNIHLPTIRRVIMLKLAGKLSYLAQLKRASHLVLDSAQRSHHANVA
jgi:hypothetical protein